MRRAASRPKVDARVECGSDCHHHFLGAIRLSDPDQNSQLNLGSDSLGKSNDLGVSNVSRIHFGFRFIVNPDPDPIIEYALKV